MQRIRKGDTVEVIAGKDLGQQGTVLRLILKDERVIVERVNVVKKHQKAQQAGNRQVAAGIVEREAPLQLSNVQLICTQCKAIGVKVTLRGERMWALLDRLINAALPRTRDFRGIDGEAFDGRGNYTLGLREQLIFPEIEYDKIDKVRGMEISIVTTAKTDEEGRRLLRLLGMPFRES